MAVRERAMRRGLNALSDIGTVIDNVEFIIEVPVVVVVVVVVDDEEDDEEVPAVVLLEGVKSDLTDRGLNIVDVDVVACVATSSNISLLRC